MSNPIKKCCLIIWLWFSVQIVIAQDSTNLLSRVSISSPTAASLGKFGDIPVSYHTGVPTIDVPIYTIESGSLKLPISLSYHSSGIKVNEPSGWVGIGWALNAGGVITRTVMGTPDEKNTSYGSLNLFGHYSNYGFNNYINENNIPDYRGFATGMKDGEPDLYFFNFNGYSGKFFFRDDHTPVCLPEDDIKIQPDYTGSGTFLGFTIVVPDGTKYYFGSTGNTSAVSPIEITNPISQKSGVSSATAASSWYLNKIISADGIDSIKLQYTNENYGYFTLSTFPIDGIPSGSNPQLFEYELVKNVVNGVRLSSISFPNGVVNFIPSNTPRLDIGSNSTTLTDDTNLQSFALGKIQITNQSNFCKQFNFGYNYFVDNDSQLPGNIPFQILGSLTTDKQRLRLDTVQEVSCDNSLSLPPYIFNYYSEKLPRRISFAYDHWGYYNGRTDNQTLIPTYTIIKGTNPYTVQGANRDPSWPEMRSGMLRQIIYPTGGKTNLDFDCNISSVQNTNYTPVNLASLLVNEYGQSRILDSTSFTIQSGNNGPVLVSIKNNCTNYTPYISIKNSAGTQMLPFQISGTNDQTFNFPADTYSVKLYFQVSNPSYLTGGADVTISQWQYSTTTSQKPTSPPRIKTIVNYDPVVDSSMTTNYLYGYAGTNTSSAIVYSIPKYLGIVRNDQIKNLGYWNATSNGGYAFTQSLFTLNGCTTSPSASFFKSPVSIQPMNTTQGGPVGYAHVEVSQSGNGKSIFEYYGTAPLQMPSGNNLALTLLDVTSCDANAPNYPPAPVPFDYMRGELKYESYYDESGNMLKEVFHTPVYTQSSQTTTPAFIVKSNAQSYLGTFYEIVSSRKSQSTEVTNEYQSGSLTNKLSTTKTTYYGSQFHHMPTKTVINTSNGDSLTAQKVYSNDFRIASADAIQDGYVNYSNACSTCLSTYNATVIQKAGNDTALSNAYLNYFNCKVLARINYVNYQKVNFTNTNPLNNYQSAHNTAKASASSELMPILELQDRSMNPVIESLQWRNSSLVSANFSRYDYSIAPTGFVYPQSTQIIPLLNPITDFSVSNVSGSTITKDARYENNGNYIFLNGRLQQSTDRSGFTTSYVWGYSNQYPVAKGQGIIYTTLQSAYSSSNGVNVQTQSTLGSAIVNTFSYNPLIGMSLQTDQQGRPTYYYYDALGRLSYVSDQDGNVIKKYSYNYRNK